MAPTICCKCDKEIDDQAICSSGMSYHPEHFTCTECEKPIGMSEFKLLKNELVCSECFLEKHAPRCYACGSLILERAIAAVGRKWHEECFKCVGCCQNLLTSTFFEVNGYLFCKDDFREAFSSRCAGCGKPIDKKAIVALNTKWHPRCFECFNCGERIATDNFNIENGNPFCLKCSREPTRNQITN
ncbi:paxillin homolog 1-like [Drosophila miranda]|uniref:paxillin homolog 1-like n=1 Tax=Drosophila miranda TaxID=7229 RepID=UPI00143F3418|nr:paxillin homolog 1-like [Drosophila miranda]XP_033252119.1 paxillin homolog 1-like [Drosophila miranda]XP_033252120.1 paxillin homolog 1-like [Drosophila miranda]